MAETLIEGCNAATSGSGSLFNGSETSGWTSINHLASSGTSPKPTADPTNATEGVNAWRTAAYNVGVFINGFSSPVLDLSAYTSLKLDYFGVAVDAGDYLVLRAFSTEGVDDQSASQLNPTGAGDLEISLSGIANKAAVTLIVGVFDTADGSGGVASAASTMDIDNIRGVTSEGETVAVGQVSETDAARGTAPAKALGITLNEEDDLAQAVAVQRAIGLSQVSEVDHAIQLVLTRIIDVSRVLETDTAAPIILAQRLGLGETIEVDQSFALVPARVLGADRALDLSFSFPLIPAIVSSIDHVEEQEETHGLTHSFRVVLDIVEEADAAFSALHSAVIAIDRVEEIDVTVPIEAGQFAEFGRAVEVDTAVAIEFVIRQKVRASRRFAQSPLIVRSNVQVRTIRRNLQ